MGGVRGVGVRRQRRGVAGVLGGVLLGLVSLGVGGADEGRPGKVVQVYDGDTVTVLVGSEFFGAQLFGIDAPELKQEHGEVAAARLSSLVMDQIVRLVVFEPDGEGTAVARLFVGAVDVSAEMVSGGHAWALPGDGHARFSGLQAEARANQLGLWKSAESAVAPWLWRDSPQASRTSSTSAGAASISAADAPEVVASVPEPELAPEADAQPESEPDKPVHVTAATLGHVSVGPGDTLRGIAARHVSSPDRVEALAMSIFDANPQGFIVSNINALVAGAMLRIPDLGSVSAEDDSLARERFVRHNAQWAERRGGSGAVGRSSGVDESGVGSEVVAQTRLDDSSDDIPSATIAWSNDESSAVSIALPRAEPVKTELPELDFDPEDDGNNVLSAAFEDVRAQLQSATDALLAPSADAPAVGTLDPDPDPALNPVPIAADGADEEEAMRARLREAQAKIDDLRRLLDLEGTYSETLGLSAEQDSGAGAGAAAANRLGIIGEMLGVEAHAGGVRYTVWYGTNRSAVHVADSVVGYGTVRDGRNHYGRAVVNIPASHEPVVMATSAQIRWIEANDGELAIEQLQPMSADAFKRDIRARLEGKSEEQRSILVYIHGFETSFEQAVVRAAQIGFDLKNPGITALYSWPSRGERMEYVADLGASEQSQDQMARFLIELTRETGAARVHLLAHSMGNRVLAYAVRSAAFVAARQTGVAFGQIILAVPDLHVDTFARTVDVYREVADGTTIYASPRHLAPDLSGWLHSYDRVGFAPPLTVVDGFDTVMVEGFGLLDLGAGYIVEAASVTNDIAQVIRGGVSASLSTRKLVSDDGPEHWVLDD